MSARRGATWAEIGNLLENFKTDMMSSISSQQDVMREKQEKVVEDLVLGVFFAKCRKKNSLKECKLGLFHNIPSTITPYQNHILSQDISLIEVEKSVREMNLGKAPGPYGFTRYFF